MVKKNINISMGEAKRMLKIESSSGAGNVIKVIALILVVLAIAFGIYYLGFIILNGLLIHLGFTAFSGWQYVQLIILLNIISPVQYKSK